MLICFSYLTILVALWATWNDWATSSNHPKRRKVRVPNFIEPRIFRDSWHDWSLVRFAKQTSGLHERPVVTIFVPSKVSFLIVVQFMFWVKLPQNFVLLQRLTIVPANLAWMLSQLCQQRHDPDSFKTSCWSSSPSQLICSEGLCRNHDVQTGWFRPPNVSFRIKKRRTNVSWVREHQIVSRLNFQTRSLSIKQLALRCGGLSVRRQLHSGACSEVANWSCLWLDRYFFQQKTAWPACAILSQKQLNSSCYCTAEFQAAVSPFLIDMENNFLNVAQACWTGSRFVPELATNVQNKPTLSCNILSSNAQQFELWQRVHQIQGSKHSHAHMGSHTRTRFSFLGGVELVHWVRTQMFNTNICVINKAFLLHCCPQIGVNSKPSAGRDRNGGQEAFPTCARSSNSGKVMCKNSRRFACFLTLNAQVVFPSHNSEM